MNRISTNTALRYRGKAAFAIVCMTALATVGLSACSSEGIQMMPIPEPPPPPEEAARFLLLRSARWPGGGRELTVGVLNRATAAPFAEDLSARFSLRPIDESPLTSKLQKVALAPGYTSILLPPRQPASERALLALAISQFVTSRPANERIALYR